MSSWYYVEGSERVGPVEQEKIFQLMEEGSLNDESFIWTKGYENWKKLGEVEEFRIEVTMPELDRPNFPDSDKEEDINWQSVEREKAIFMIKVGIDRGGAETEYGPFSLSQLKRAYDERRVNGKTLVFTPGMPNWKFLADIPIFETVFDDLPPVIKDEDRRKSIRKPFVARLLFHDNAEIFEGICRDVSVGGLQILVSSAPCRLGDEVTLNVHPDNTKFNFTAQGTVVRVLDGNSGFSLRFNDLNNDAAEAINNYIHSD